MKNKGRVLITGATGKLGRVIATHLGAQGWNLVVTSRDAERAKALADQLAQTGVEATGLALDFTEADAPLTAIRYLAAEGQKITHLVNNARSLDRLAIGPDGTTSRADFLGEFDIDVAQPYRLTMALVADPNHALRTVVNIGSQYGHVAPNPVLYGGTLMGSPVQYGVAKAALNHLTREMAARLAPGVRVNCVAFGGFGGRADSDFADRYGRMVPMGRMLDDTEAGGPVAFLLSEDSAAVNGHILVADGGWSVW